MRFFFTSSQSHHLTDISIQKADLVSRLENTTMRSLALYSAVLSFFAGSALAANSDAWKSRSIYFVSTCCDCATIHDY